MSQKGGYLIGGTVDQRVGTVLQEDVDQSGEGWIAEGYSLVGEVVVESRIVVVYYLLDDGQLGLSGLQHDESSAATATRPSADLGHHHVGMFESTEVRVVEHGVGVEYADDADAVEVEALADHLRANEQIGAACGKVTDDALVGLARTGGVEVHSADAGFGEDLAHLVFYLFHSRASAAACSHRRDTRWAPDRRLRSSGR